MKTRFKEILSSGFVVFIFLVALVASGILAWRTVEPDDFASSIFFILMWGAAFSLLYLIIQFVVGIIEALINKQ